jgi:signal transduction histidine kinase
MTVILVVEDEAMLRREIAECLRYEDYEVITARDGREGAELARQHLPDLILSDIMMPEMDGYGLLLALREEEATSRIPFIFLTARAEYTDIRRGMTFGADDYLVKPFETEDLLAAIRTRLAKQAEANRYYERRVESLRSSIVNTIPHELRTPLTGIMGYVALLLNDFNRYRPEQIMQMLQSIQRASARLYRLVQNYLLFAQLSLIGVDDERLELISRFQSEMATDPQKVIPPIADERAILVDRRTDLIIEVGSAIVRMMAEDFSKIVEEVLDNAFKFSAKGTPVTVNGQQVGEQYVLTITDRGRGMSLDQIREVNAFVQFDRRLYEQQGAGLGLAVSQRLARIYGANLSIESALGEGTQVKITVPAAH